ncbi:GNAT family N-acetyltransferase [Tistrella mobilis]|uniref:GNAT family N-acetyltransferase n=1 Tax=Tistrella mobilis TaxID=171437 RepID=UPI0031F71C6D
MAVYPHGTSPCGTFPRGTFTPLTADTAAMLAAFLAAHADPETRRMAAEPGAAERLVIRNTRTQDPVRDEFWHLDGRLRAVLTSIRTRRPDGRGLVNLVIWCPADDPEALAACLDQALNREALARERDRPEGAACDTRYTPLPGRTEPLALLRARGFRERAGRVRYRRDPAPLRATEVPHADRALARGYATRLITAAEAEACADLFDRVAHIHNRCFGARGDGAGLTGRVIRAALSPPGSGLILASRNDDLAAYLLFTAGHDGLLGSECACLRRHWGSGAADLVCREMITHAWTHGRQAITAWADATNTASRRMLERAGLQLTDSFNHWVRPQTPP